MREMRRWCDPTKDDGWEVRIVRGANLKANNGYAVEERFLGGDWKAQSPDEALGTLCLALFESLDLRVAVPG